MDAIKAETYNDDFSSDVELDNGGLFPPSTAEDEAETDDAYVSDINYDEVYDKKIHIGDFPREAFSIKSLLLQEISFLQSDVST